MSLELKVEKRNVRSDAPQALFNDRSILVIQAETRRYGEIVGLHSAGLYKSDRLVAGIVDSTRYATKDQRGFWSRGEVTQKDFATYFSMAIKDMEYGSEFQRKCSKIPQGLIRKLEKKKVSVLKQKPENIFYDSPP